MKKIVTFFLSATFAVCAMAQSVNMKSVTIEEVPVNAYAVTLGKDVKTVQKALEQFLKDAKLKTSSKDGFQVALAQVIPQIAETPTNFYVKVSKTKDKKNPTEVAMCTLPSNENVARYLESFVEYIGRYEASLNMQAEQKNLNKAQKELSKASAAVASIDKSIQSDQEKIASKKKAIEGYKAKIKECENDIKSLEASISKNQDKKAEAQKKEQKAQQNVSGVEQEVEKYRSMTE